jgi:hypothetical protein
MIHKPLLLRILVGFVTFFSIDASAQNLAPVNVVLIPDISGTYGDRAIYAAIRTTVGNSSALYHPVERENYDAILKAREAASKLKDDPYVATVLKGAAVAIEFKIKEYSEEWDSFPVLAAAYSRDFDYTLKIKCVYDLKVTDITTSEIIDSKEFVVTGVPTKIKKPFIELQKHAMRINALAYVRRGVRKASSRFLLQAISPAIPIFKTYENNGVDHLLITGGKGTAYPGGTTFRLIRESKIMIQGEPVLRQETVGEAVVRKNYSGYTDCTIVSLKAGVSKSVVADYVIPSALNEVPLEWNEKPAPPKQ